MSRRPLLVGAVVVGVVLATAGPLIAGPWLTAGGKAAVVNVVQPLADLTAAVLLLLRAVSAHSRAARRSWFLLSAGWLLFAVGDTIWSAYGFLVDGYATAADFFYPPGTLLALAGLVLFPVVGARRVSRARLLLDATVLASAVTLMAFMLVLDGIFASLGSGVEAVLFAFYPIADLLIVVVVLLLLLRAARHRPDLSLIGLGFASLVVADVSFAVVSLDGDFVAAVVSDVPYLMAPLLISLGAVAPDAPRRGLAAGRGRGALLPDLAVLAAFVTLAAQGIDSWGTGTLTLLAMSLAVVRQVWLASENHRLRRDLERRVAERTAEAEGLARRQQQILQSVGEGIVGIDQRGRISFANETAERLLDAEPGSLVGRPACATLHGVGAHEGEPCTCAAAVLEGRHVTSDDQEFVRSDGSRFPAELIATPHSDVTDPSVAVLVFRDITERRATEKMKAEFVSIVSHELRTPLTSIRGSLDLLADGDVGELSPPVSRVVEIARRGSERLTRLINDILVIERLDAGSLPMNFSDQPAVPLTESAVGALVPIAGVEDVTLVVDAAPCTLRVDADRYVQVLTNLVGNAIKFTPRAGTVTVTVTAAGQTATVRVADTGRGIPPDALEAVFQRFHQVEAGDRQASGGGGSGLGLAISRSIVDSHGGSIWVESEVGVGSTFSFTVPVRPIPEPPVDAAVVETAAASPSTQPAAAT